MMTAGLSTPPDSHRTDTIAGLKFDDKDPFRHWIAFQKIDLSATCDDAPAKAGNCRQRARQMSLIGSRVAYVDITNDVGGHGGLWLIAGFQADVSLPQSPAPPQT